MVKIGFWIRYLPRTEPGPSRISPGGFSPGQGAGCGSLPLRHPMLRTGRHLSGPTLCYWRPRTEGQETDGESAVKFRLRGSAGLRPGRNVPRRAATAATADADVRPDFGDFRAG